MNLPMSHPLWLHGGGLGLPARLVYNALDPDEGQQRGELSTSTGLKPPAVGRALRALHEVGAAHKDQDRRWFLDPTFDPDAAAQRLGLTAKRDRRDARLDEEARLHKEAVAAARSRYQTTDDLMKEAM